MQTPIRLFDRKSVALAFAIVLSLPGAAPAAQKASVPEKSITKGAARNMKKEILSPAAAVKASAPAAALTEQGPATEKGPGAVVVEQQNCGTYHTGWVDDPEAVNPCPAACQRGERFSIDEHASGGTTQYDAIYRCHMPEQVFNQKPEIARQIEAGGITGVNCGTFWTDNQEDANSDANPCPADCERGELLDVRRNNSYDGSQTLYQMNYRCYKAGTTNLVKALPASGTTLSPATPQAPLKAGPTTAKDLMSDLKTAGAKAAAPTADLKAAPANAKTDLGGRDLNADNLNLPQGEGTLDLQVEPSDIAPSSAKFIWNYPQYDANIVYDIYVSNPGEDQFTLLAGNVLNDYWTQIGQGEGEGRIAFYSLPLDPTKAYQFALIQRNPDGSILREEAGPFQPVPPHAPAKLVAIQTGDTTVSLIWPKVWEYIRKEVGCKDPKKCPDVEGLHYQILGDSDESGGYFSAQDTKGLTEQLLAVLPPEFVDSTDPKDYRRANFKKLPHGTYHFSVGAVYDNDEKVSVEQWPSAEVTVKDFSDKYEVSIWGIDVHQATEDDPLERDGKGDEIYFASRIYSHTSSGGNRGNWKSPVFGDINGFKLYDERAWRLRIQAGSASDKGGIKTGDYLGLRPMDAGVVQHEDFPYNQWDGNLRNLWDYVYITPSIWEWDVSDPAPYPDQVFDQFNQPGEFRETGGIGFGQYYFSDGSGVCHLVNDTMSEQDQGAWNQSYTRPIGMKRNNSGALENPECRTLYLTRPGIEAALGALNSQVVSLDFQDAKSGHYTMYLKIERLPKNQ